MLTSRLFGGTPTTFLPCRKTSPSVGSSNPAIMRIVVVLPRPDGPSSEKNSPSPMVTSTPLTAATASPCAWNVLVIPLSSIAASSVPTSAVSASFVSVTSGSAMAPHVLDARVVLEPVHRQVLAVPRVLEAAVRHLRHERDVGVDPHGAEVELLGHPHRAGVVLGPDARGQAVLDAVRPAQCLRLVAELLHGDHRTEDLVLDLLVVLLETGQLRGLVEVAQAALAVAAGDHRRVVGEPVD